VIITKCKHDSYKADIKELKAASHHIQAQIVKTQIEIDFLTLGSVVMLEIVDMINTFT